MKQGVLFDEMQPQDPSIKKIGSHLFLKFSDEDSQRVRLYNQDTLIRSVDLSDRAAKRLLVVEAVEMGANQTWLANTLKISRQTIHNYVEIKKHFGLEGLIHNYSPSVSKSRRKQRQKHINNRGTGNKARQLEKMRKEQKQKLPVQEDLGSDEEIKLVDPDEHPYAEVHEWERTRYAGVFVYLITLIAQNQWLQMVMGFFGNNYRLFLVFVLIWTLDKNNPSPFLRRRYLRCY